MLHSQAVGAGSLAPRLFHLCAWEEAVAPTCSGTAATHTQAGTELAWLVCRSSMLNADELARSGGLPVLGGLVQRWLDAPTTRALLEAGGSSASCLHLAHLAWTWLDPGYPA